MNINRTLKVAAALLSLSTINHQLSTASAQGTAFSYQGRLNDGANPASGIYDLRFAIYDAAGSGTPQGVAVTNSPTTLSNGLFAVTLDFGVNIFTGNPRWLEIGVRTNGGGAFTPLTPRQPLTPSPYAIYSAKAGTAGNFSGSLGGDVSGTQGATVVGSVGGYVATAVASGASAANAAGSANLPGTLVKRDGAGNFAAANISGVFIGNGAGLTNLTLPAANLIGTINGAQIAPAAIGTSHLNTSNSPVTGQILGFSGSGLAWANNAALGNWSLSGNAGTTPGTQFLGTTDNQPLELKVGAVRGWRLEPGGSNSVNVVGGWSGNGVAAGVAGAVVAGGGAGNYGSQSFSNVVEAHFGTVSGGRKNVIQPGARSATIGGGAGNTIQTNAEASTIAGGTLNLIQADAPQNFIGGGLAHLIEHDAVYGTIAGGNENSIGISVYGGTISGGANNLLQFSSTLGVIGGGLQNQIGESVDYATIGGGLGNAIEFDADQATIGGGSGNIIQPQAWLATIGGGINNRIQYGAFSSTVGGGFGNTILTNAEYATIPGGHFNSATNYAFAAGHRAKANHTGAFVWADSTDADFASTGTKQFLIRASGGVGIGTTSPGAALAVSSPGGAQTLDVAGSRSGNFSAPVAYIQNANSIGGSGPALRLLGQGNAVDGVLNIGNTGTGKIVAFGAAGGEVANLDTNGNFSFGTATRQMLNLWGTVYGVGVQNNTLYTRSDGGFAWFNKGSHTNSANDPGSGGTTLMTLDSSGNLRTVTGTISTLSDRNAKANFEAVDARDVLERVAALPITRWNFKNAPATQRHIGPMAQDFHAAFNVGLEATGICTVDADGVALAAIQGLNQKLEETRAENVLLKRELSEIKQLLLTLTDKKD